MTTTHKDVIDRERNPPPKLYKSSCHIGHGEGNNNLFAKQHYTDGINTFEVPTLK